MKEKSPAKHHNVYVVELSREVLEEQRFVEANPHYRNLKPCIYVGCTGLSPKERFANHQLGYKSNRFVYRYGIRLLPHLYEKYNPMSYADASAMEKELAGTLRRQGYAVWQN
jgi:hypothetical protein